MLTLYHKMSALWNCHFCTKIAFYGPLCLFEMWRPLGTKLYWILWFFLVSVLLCHQIGQDDHFPGCWCLLRRSDDLLEVTKGTLTSSSENRTWWNSPTNTILIKSILHRADCPQRHFHPMPCKMLRTLFLLLRSKTKQKQDHLRLSSPRAESARAFTGRRNSHSRRGEDFLSRQPNFFTETAVTPEQKVKKWFPTWEINRHAEG